MIDIKQAKIDLRKRLRAFRAEILREKGEMAAREIADAGLSQLVPTPVNGAVIGAFASMPEELDTAPLLSRLDREGFSLALPVMIKKGEPLIFRTWCPGDVMAKVMWGIREPTPDKPVQQPDILLVPLLAFDKYGFRLGYGGGFYDRTIHALRAVKTILTVGFAIDEQEVDRVPHSEFDEPLDWVLTPSGARRCRR